MTDQLLDPQDAAAPDVPPATVEPDAAPAETATSPQSVKADTTYVVLVLNKEPAGDVWVESGSQAARDAKTAIRQYVDGLTEKDGTFVAVPTSSWKPVAVTTKTTTTLVIGDAS